MVRLRIVLVMPDRQKRDLVQLAVVQIDRAQRKLIFAVFPQRFSEHITAEGDREVVGNCAAEEVPHPPIVAALDADLQAVDARLVVGAEGTQEALPRSTIRGVKVWNATLEYAGSDALTALVLASSARAAGDALVTSAKQDLGVVSILDLTERPFTAEVLDISMPNPAVGDENLSVAGPGIYKVAWNDGLFHRSAGASLAAAPDAIAALRVVIAADPFEGIPPYGVPPAFGPVSRFIVTEPYVCWLRLDWPEPLSTT